MAIMKNEIPILEYDTNPMAVIMPKHDYDERDWGEASVKKALYLCFDIIAEM